MQELCQNTPLFQGEAKLVQKLLFNFFDIYQIFFECKSIGPLPFVVSIGVDDFSIWLFNLTKFSKIRGVWLYYPQPTYPN